MIITRTPLRMSFAGGGSDIASFYTRNGGCVLSTSIDKYIYISIHPSFRRRDTVLKYSKTEIVEDISKIEHRIFGACLNKLGVSGVEIASNADIPAGTGLGSSSTFTVGLLHALYAYKSKFVGKERLASEACDIEISKLKEPIGKQDQYAASYGGLKFYRFLKNGSVTVEPIIMDSDKRKSLEDNLIVFYTGDTRSASKILAEQTVSIASGDKEKAQLKICRLAEELKGELENGNIDAMGSILHENWLLKRTLASGISSGAIDTYYDIALKSGAMGGKLLGAGGGGFLLFYAPKNKHNDIKNALKDLSELKIRLDNQGSSIIYVGENSN